jgi:hypothetical protein
MYNQPDSNIMMSSPSADGSRRPEVCPEVDDLAAEAIQNETWRPELDTPDPSDSQRLLKPIELANRLQLPLDVIIWMTNHGQLRYFVLPPGRLMFHFETVLADLKQQFEHTGCPLFESERMFNYFSNLPE